MLLCLLASLLLTARQVQGQLLNLAATAVSIDAPCCGTTSWSDLNSGKLTKTVSVNSMLQGDSIIFQLDNAYDVGTVVIVADSYLTRTGVRVFAGATSATTNMVQCNDRMNKSHDGAHDCQVPQASYVVIRLIEDAVGGDFNFKEIQIFQERELGRNNLAIASNGVAALTFKTQVTGIMPKNGQTSSHGKWENFSSDPGYIKVQQSEQAERSYVVLYAKKQTTSNPLLTIESSSQQLGNGWSTCSMQNGNYLTQTTIVIASCTFQADGWQVIVPQSAALKIANFVVLKEIQCLYAEKAYFREDLLNLTYDIPIDQTVTVQLPGMYVFPSCGGFTADTLKIFTDNTMTTIWSDANYVVSIDDATLVLSFSATDITLAGTTLDLYISTSLDDTPKFTQFEPLNLVINLVDSCTTTTLDPLDPSFISLSGPYDYYGETTQPVPDDLVAATNAQSYACGLRGTIIEDMDVGGVPAYFTANLGDGNAGSTMTIQAFGSNSDFTDYGIHTVKLTIYLVNYPTVFVERTLTINIVCQAYDNAPNLVVDTAMPNTFAIHGPYQPVDTQLQMSTFHWERAPCFSYDTFKVLDTSDASDKTAWFSGFDPATSTLSLTGNTSFQGTTSQYKLFVLSKKQDGSPLSEESLDIFTVKWCGDPALFIVTPAPTLTFSHEPGFHTNTVVQTSTFTIDPAFPCWNSGPAAIKDSSGTNQSTLFKIDYTNWTIELIGDVSLAGQTISYDLNVQIVDSDTLLDYSILTKDSFTVEWKNPPVCDSITTSLDVVAIPDQVFTFTGSHSLVTTIPADSLSTSRADASFCGTRFGNTYDSNTLQADPAYFSIDPSNAYNSGDSVTIAIAAADYTLVGEHLVSLKWTITGTDVLRSTPFKITFTCDNTVIPSAVISTPALTLAFVHDNLSVSPTNAQMSIWALDVGSPCFTYSNFIVSDAADTVDLSGHFAAFDEINFVLPLVGNAALVGQTISYKLKIQVVDESGTPLIIAVEDFSVEWTTACFTAVLDSSSVSNIIVPYGGTDSQSISEPSDSVATAHANPTICGVRTASIFDDDTGLAAPYASATIAAGIITITATTSDPTLLGHHNVFLRVVLQDYQHITVNSYFTITFQCDPALPTPTLTIGTPAAITYFQHDPNNASANVQLTTFTITPSPPCYTYQTFVTNNDLTGIDVTSDYRFGFDPTTSVLTLIGDTTELFTTRLYTFRIIVQDTVFSQVADLFLDTFYVGWVPDETCTDTIFLPDMSNTNFIKTMGNGDETFTINLPNRESVVNGNNLLCGDINPSYLLTAGGTDPTITVQPVSSSISIDIVVQDPDFTLTPGATVKNLDLTATLVDHSGVTITIQIGIQYACPIAPQGVLTTTFDESIPLVYSLTTMGSQSYQLNDIVLYPTNCGFVADSTTLMRSVENTVDTHLSYDIPTYTLTATKTFDPLKLPTKHNTQETQRRIVTYIGSSNTPGTTWTIQTASVVFKFLFDNVNSVVDCPTTTVDPNTETLTPLSMTYKGAPIVLTFADNTDTFGSRYNDFYFCGQRMHTFTEAVTGNPIPWITYSVDPVTQIATFTIDPLLSAGGIKQWSIEWRTGLVDYSGVLSTSPRILTLDIICPLTPLINSIGSTSLPASLTYELNSGPEVFGPTSGNEDDTDGLCFTYTTAVHWYDTVTSGIGLESPDIIFDWEGQQITVNSFNPLRSGYTGDYINVIFQNGVIVMQADIYSVTFTGGCTTATMVTVPTVVLTPTEYQISTLIQSGTQPSDTYGTTLLDFKACGMRSITGITQIDAGGNPVAQNFLSVVLNPVDNTLQYYFAFNSVYDSTKLGVLTYEIEYGLQDWAMVPTSYFRVSIDILCPAEPVISLTGGTAQDPEWPRVFDSSQGIAVNIDVPLESYEFLPTFCPYPLQTTVLDVGTGLDKTSTFTSIDIAAGQIDLFWNGADDGIYSLVWTAKVLSPLAPEVVQNFKISYLDFTTLDCNLALFTPNPTSFAITDVWTQQQSEPFPPIWTDIDKMTGMIDFCGTRAFEYTYIDGVEDWMSVNIATNMLDIFYTEQKALNLNNASIRVSLVTYPLAINVDLPVSLTVTCPAQHDSVDVHFNNTLILYPTIYYDSSANLPQTSSLNVRHILPADVDDLGQVTMDCFFVTQNYFTDISDNSIVNFITVTDFNHGLIEINLFDVSYGGTTKNYNWSIDIDDGTGPTFIQTFTVVFKTLAHCTETSLQQGWAPVLHQQKMFEAIPTQYPLIQPTDTLSTQFGIPTHCGSRTYRFLDKSTMTVFPNIYHDTSTMTYWIDIQDEYYLIGVYDVILEVSLTDHSSVTPVFQLFTINVLCSDLHHSIDVMLLQSNLWNYDVTEAVLETYTLDSVMLLPKDCFSATNLRLQDSAATPVSYVTVTPTDITSDPVAQAFTATMDLAGVRMFDWIATPMILNWTVDVSDGTTAIAKTLTVQGTSLCSTATMPLLADETQSKLPEETPLPVIETSIFDSQTASRSGINDYCGPQVFSVLQNDTDSTVNNVFTYGSITTPAPGHLTITYLTATHQDYGSVTIDVSVSFQYFPALIATKKATVEYLCPVDTVWIVDALMPITEFIYHVDDHIHFEAELSDPRVVCVCHNVTDQYITRADNDQRVTYITTDIVNNNMTLFTLDKDQALRTETVHYNWNMDLSDGTIGNIIAQFQIEFTAKNFLPYFDPPLESVIQFYKTWDPQHMTYTLPPEFDEDIRDTAVVTVDLKSTAGFINIDSENIMSIIDLSSPSVPVGHFFIQVNITDQRDLITYDIAVIVYEALAYVLPEEIVIEIEEEPIVEEEVIETEVIEEVVDDGADEIVVELKEFDWRAAFKKKEESNASKLGNEFSIIPPKASLKYIAQTGEVQVSFDQDMRIIQDLKDLQKSTVTIDDKTHPIVGITVEAGEYSSPANLGFEWSFTSMTKRSLNIQLVFTQAIHVSANELPDKLIVTLYDRYSFVSVNDLAIVKKRKEKPEQRQLSSEDKDNDDFIYLERELPTQMQIGGAAETVQAALGQASESSKVAMASNFLINILISASLNQLWAMINTQQMMVMMPLFKIEMPANASMFFKHVMEIAAFDFYDFGDIIHDIMKIEATDPIDQNFEAVGFESQYWMVNLGTMFVFYLIYIAIALFIAPSLYCCRGKSKRIKKFSKKLSKAVYWGVLLTLINESYIIVIVCIMINLKIFSMDSLGLQIMSISGAVFITLGVLIPTLIITYLLVNFKKLKSPAIEDKYGALYDELRLGTGKTVFLQPSFFLVRRFLLAVAICLVGKILIWQIFIMSSQIILQVIIVGSDVFQDHSKRRLENFNELVLMSTMYTIICYSPWVDDVELKFQLGYVTIGFVILHLVINLFLIFRGSFIMVRNKCRKKFIMKKYKKTRGKLQKRLKDNHENRLQRTKKLINEAKEALEKESEQEANADKEKEKEVPIVVEQVSESVSYTDSVRLAYPNLIQTIQLLIGSEVAPKPDQFSWLEQRGNSYFNINLLKANNENQPQIDLMNLQSQQQLIDQNYNRNPHLVEESKGPINLDEFEADLYENESKIGQVKRQIQDQAMKDIEEQSAYFLNGPRSRHSGNHFEVVTTHLGGSDAFQQTTKPRPNQIVQDQFSPQAQSFQDQANQTHHGFKVINENKVPRRIPFAMNIKAQEEKKSTLDPFPWHEYANNGSDPEPRARDRFQSQDDREYTTQTYERIPPPNKSLLRKMEKAERELNVGGSPPSGLLLLRQQQIQAQYETSPLDVPESSSRDERNDRQTNVEIDLMAMMNLF